MSVLASVTRPDEWDLPLFIHVLSALTLIGALTLTSTYLISTWRSGSSGSLRLGLRSLLIGVLPAWTALHVSALWIADEQGYADLDEPPDWIDIGYMVTDGGFLLIVISAVLAWLAVRKVRKGQSGPFVGARFAAGLITFLLLLNLVALWAMTTKPG